MAKTQKFIGAEEIFKVQKAAWMAQGGRLKKKGRKPAQTPPADTRERFVHHRTER